MGLQIAIYVLYSIQNRVNYFPYNNCVHLICFQNYYCRWPGNTLTISVQLIHRLLSNIITDYWTLIIYIMSFQKFTENGQQFSNLQKLSIENIENLSNIQICIIVFQNKLNGN